MVIRRRTGPIYVCAWWGREYAAVVFDFWFWSAVGLLMLVLTGFWWVVAMRLIKRKLWRVLVSIFLAVQMAAHFSLMVDFNWPLYGPKALLVAVVVWNRVGVVLAFVVLLVIGI